jgi:hypothetical protein
VIGRSCSTHDDYKFVQNLIEISERKRQLGRPKRRWKRSVELDFEVVGCVDVVKSKSKDEVVPVFN